MRNIQRSIQLEASAEKVFALLKRSSTLVFVAGTMIHYSEGDLPVFWQTGKKINIRPRLFGLFAATDHFVEFTKIDEDNFIITTRETGEDITSWNHTMLVRPLSSMVCEYTDVVEIEASTYIYLFAQIFYWYRHRRWVKLLKQLETRQ